MIIKKRHKLKQRDINVLCMIYIMEKQGVSVIASRNVVDMLLLHNLVNPVKSIYENIRGLLHEHQYRYMTVDGTAIFHSTKGGPRTSFTINPHGFSYIKEFYEKYRSPIEGVPSVDNTILKDNIGESING
jgi:hypothetical protein